MFTRKEDENSGMNAYTPGSSSTSGSGSTAGNGSSSRTTLSGESDPNVISKGTRIQGDVYCDGDIRIDGEVKGTIRSRSKVMVGKGGFVNGDIECRQAEVVGRVKGSLKIQDLLFLRGDARMEGDVLTSHFEMEPSVKFNGKCTMQDKVELSAITAREEKPDSRSGSTPPPKNSGLAKANGEKENKVAGGIFQKQNV